MKDDKPISVKNIYSVKNFGVAIRRIRKQKKLSQAQLSKLAGIRQPTISDVESGKGTLESAFRILQALSVEMILTNEGITQWVESDKTGLKTFMKLKELENKRAHGKE